MKKIFLSALILFGLMLTFQPSAQAAYPAHINGDHDYILTFGRQGVGYYVQRSSLNVEQYKPPIYILSIKVYYVNDADRGGTRLSQPTTLRFRYDWDSRAMYSDSAGKWNYIDPKQYASNVAIGEMAFYIAYGKKFYGTNGYFNDDFYAASY